MIDYSRKKGSTEQVVSETDIPVLHRSEEVYDKNNDGKLSKDEVKLYLEDVLSSIETWGQAQAKSSVLTPFDKDNNGSIDIQEAALIRALQESGE